MKAIIPKSVAISVQINQLVSIHAFVSSGARKAGMWKHPGARLTHFAGNVCTPTGLLRLCRTPLHAVLHTFTLSTNLTMGVLHAACAKRLRDTLCLLGGGCGRGYPFLQLPRMHAFPGGLLSGCCAAGLAGSVLLRGCV